MDIETELQLINIHALIDEPQTVKLIVSRLLHAKCHLGNYEVVTDEGISQIPVFFNNKCNALEPFDVSAYSIGTTYT